MPFDNTIYASTFAMRYNTRIQTATPTDNRISKKRYKKAQRSGHSRYVQRNTTKRYPFTGHLIISQNATPFYNAINTVYSNWEHISWSNLTKMNMLRNPQRKHNASMTFANVQSRQFQNRDEFGKATDVQADSITM
jgi:hypothetical protein